MKIDLIKIGHILNCSTVDWPKKTVSVIFLSNCQFRCPWCQNPDLVESKGRELPISYVVGNIVENRKLIDGVVISGGEPTLQKDALFELCKRLKQLNLSIMLDTNGVDSDVICDLVTQNLIQRVAIDFKAPIDDLKLFQKMTGTRDDEFLVNFKKTLELSKDWNIEIEYRTTVVPTINSDEDIIERIARSIPKCDLYTLQQFSSQNPLLDPSYSKISSPTLDEMRKLGQIAKKHIKNVMIKTVEAGEEYL